jgi:hypothetical protein
MATVEVIEPGKKVKVGPDDVTLKDTLEYAELAIGRYGWRQGAIDKDEPTMQALAESGKGLSLHDALGFAQASLSGGTGERSGGKDAPVGKVTRNQAMDAVKAELKKQYPDKGYDDKSFNDLDTTTEQDVIDLLRRTREAV